MEFFIYRMCQKFGKILPGTFFHVFSRVQATLQPALSVGWSVGRSVGRSHFIIFYDFISLTSVLLPKWSGDLKYGPCLPARDFGSRVSGLVLFSVSFRFPQFQLEKVNLKLSWMTKTA